MPTDTAENYKSSVSDAYESSSQDNNNETAKTADRQEERSLSYRERVKIENDQILRDLEEKDREA